MELLYSVRRKPLKCEPPRFDSTTDSEIVRPICTISIANIIAFSSLTELDDVEGDTWGGHVYVCDLDTPWDCHKVATTAHPVSALEWDLEGNKLLIATSVGEVSVHGQKEHLLNEWQCLYSATFPAEHIIQAAFFDPGRRLVAVPTDKKDAPVAERIQLLRPTPTLKGFGGVPCEGVFIVTATGLIGAVLPPADCEPATTATDCLRPTRDHVTAASIAYKNGGLLVAAVCPGRCGAGGAAGGGGGARGCVRVYLCTVSKAPPALSAQALPAIYLRDNDLPATVAWCRRSQPDALLAGGTLWQCAERAHPVHKLLGQGPVQGSTTPGGGPKPASDTFNTLAWVRGAAWGGGVEGCAVAAAAARPPQALLVLATRTHVVLLTHTLHVLASRQVNTTNGAAPETAPSSSPPKKPKYGPGLNGSGERGGVCDVAISALGGVCVCVEPRALHVLRITGGAAGGLGGAAGGEASSVAGLLPLLEWSLAAGTDCLDLLLGLKPAVLEQLYDRLTESFQRQPASFQQFYYHSWLKLRITLCRMSAHLQASASSLTCVQMCGAVLAACGAALRPELALPLPLLDDDSEKSICALEAKPELLAECGGLGALRLGLQRALDTALTCVAQHPRPHHLPHGYEVWTEPGALGVLRRLVAAARALARGPGADCLSRLLARLATPTHYKQDLLDECSTLAAQSTSPRVWDCLPRCCVSAPHARLAPMQFEFGVEPEALRYTPEAPAYAQCETTPSLAMDAIRYMYLGGGWRPARWRQCGRCGSRALPAAHPARHPLQRAYDARFLSNCRCGGKWTLVSNI